MQWQQFIYTKLNLGDKTSKVVSDHTGILSSIVFLTYLDENHVNYLVTDKVPEMLISGTNPSLIILTNLKEVPAFITNKFAHKHFTYSDIPLNGEIAGILRSRDTIILIQLLNYVFATDFHLVLTKHNIDNLIIDAQKFAIKIEITFLIDQVTSILLSVPQIDSVLQLGRVWGKLVYLSVKQQDNCYESYMEQIDSFTYRFIQSEGMKQVAYSSTPKSPKSVDRILPNIKTENKEKIALVCFDCMGYAEWYLLQEYLSNSGFNFTEIPLFTLLPSVTSISRTAIFHGSRDVYNIKTPNRANEAKAFADFFKGKDTKYFADKDTITDNTLLGYNCISILFTFFDELCHSAQFPPNNTNKELYFNAIKAYLGKSTVLQTLQILRINGFTIYLCSDHGSVVAIGNGKKLEKYLIDSFAKRAVIVPVATVELIEHTKIKIPFVDDRLIVLPEGRTMFANKNQVEINHGGITVEEIVVPFIKLN